MIETPNFHEWIACELREVAEKQAVKFEEWDRYLHAYQGHGGAYEQCARCHPSLRPWYVRVPRHWYWTVRGVVRRWRPHVHLGPCDTEDWR